MQVQETSRKAYRQLSLEQVQTEKSKIFATLKVGTFKDKPVEVFSLREIAYETGLAVNVVWSRICSLEKKGITEVYGLKVCGVTGMEVQAWRLKK
jgi:RecA/RadA recombinase